MRELYYLLKTIVIVTINNIQTNMFDRTTCYLYDTAITIRLKTVIRTECIDASNEHKNRSDTKNEL